MIFHEMRRIRSSTVNLGRHGVTVTIWLCMTDLAENAFPLLRCPTVAESAAYTA